MGGVISGEQWLLELSNQGPHQRRVAGHLLRMQLLLQRRLGHTLILGYEYSRRSIVHAARYGRLASLTVECQGCHCQASLSEWQRASLMSAAHCGQVAAIGRDKGLRQQVLYLLPCPGIVYANDLLDSMHLPEEG